MHKRLCSLIALAATGTALIAGCGSSSSSSSTSSTSTPAAATSTSSTSSGSTSSTSSSASSNPAIAQAVTACKASVDSQASISATVKTKLDHICDEAGAGNKDAVKRATADVCIEIVKESVPSSAQQAAEASCPKP